MKTKHGSFFGAAVLALAAIVALAGCEDPTRPSRPGFGPPGAPTGVTAEAQSASSISVSWDSVSGATGYSVYRATGSGDSYSYITYTSGASYTDTGLSPNTTYYYKVSASNDRGEGSQSTSYGQATTQPSDSAPEAPTGITAEALSTSSIRVSWNPVSDASSYSVYRADSSYGNYSNIGSTNDASYTDAGLSPDTMYYYKVSASNDYGEGAQSTTYGYATTQSINNAVISLTEGVWHDRDMTVSGPEYYRFAVASGGNYEVRWNDSYEGNYTKSLNVKVSAYYETNTVYIFTDRDSGYSDPSTFTATSSDNVIIKVVPINAGNTGTYAVKYQSFTPSYTVSGTIYTDDPGGPASGASVQLQRGGSNVGSPVVTAADGTYAIPDVPAETGYTIEVSLSGYVTDTISSFDVAGNVTNKDLTLVYVITVDTVTVSPAAPSVDRGGTQTFSAEVTGTGNPAQTVTWTVSGNNDSGTTISAAGALAVAANETATSLTVTATSTVDATKSGTATVTVTMSPTDMEAEAFKTTYGDILDKTVDNITVAEEGDVDAAIADYNGLSPAAQGLLGAQKTLLDSLKAKIEELKKGQAEITLVYPTDVASGALSNNPITIAKIAGSYETTHTLTVIGVFDSYQWRVDGFAKGSGKTFTLNAGDYALGIHQILLEVTRNGAVYSKTGFFTVQ